MPRQLVCQHCNLSFQASRSDSKYCTTCRPLVQKAQAAAWEKAHTSPRKQNVLYCIDCGVQFVAVRNDALRCVSCNHQKRLEKDRNRAGWACVECGTRVARRSSRCRSCAKRFENLTEERNPNWKGERSRHKGYVMVRNNKPGKVSPYQGEHIVVWEEANGEELPRGWNVHHFNGIKDDNRPDNLIALSPSAHHIFGPDVRRQYEERIKNREERIKELEAQCARSLVNPLT